VRRIANGRALPHLAELAEKVARGHSERDPELAEVCAVIAAFGDVIDPHILQCG
jgi:hypothetical protein